MQITGSWRLYIRPGWGQDADWDNLPTITFADGRITLDDGSHPEFVHEKGALRFSFPVAGGDAGRRIANIMIDRGSEGYLQGWRHLADRQLPDFPDPQTELPNGDRCVRIELIREDKFKAFRAEREGCAAAQRRVLEDAEAETMPNATVH